MTLPEVMVAVGIGSLILSVIATVFMTSARSFVAMGNYVHLDANSRNALDHMSREIRQARGLAQFNTNSLKFIRQTNSFLIYAWSPESRKLTEWKTGDSITNVLLTDCDQLAFSLRDAQFVTTINISEAKGIKVAWKCSRKVLGNQTSTEEMQQALIVMRNTVL